MGKCFQQALEALRRGGVIVHATETCYGFACDIFNRRALASLYKTKKMSPKKPVSILVPDFASAKKYGKFSPLAQKLAKKYWPGPLTIIVKRKKTLPSFLNPGINTIGIRVPAHAFSRSLAKAFGYPLATTSANISGFPPPYSVSEIQKQFRGQKLKPDFILNFGRIEKNPPSTIVDMSGAAPRILRQGGMVLFTKAKTAIWKKKPRLFRRQERPKKLIQKRTKKEY